MADASSFVEKTYVSETQQAGSDDAPEVATLIQAKDINAPQIRAWQLSNLAEEDKQKAQAVEEQVVAKIKAQIQPEITRQTELLKKEAFEAAKREGFDQGYAEGKALGEQEGREIALAEAKEALLPEIERMHTLLSALNAPYERLEANVFENLVNLAVHLAEEVIEQAVQGSSDWMLKIIRDSVGLLQDDLSPIEITLNPQDLLLIETHGGEFAKHWHLQGDPDVALGTCRIKQGFSSVEHNWKNRFETMSVKLQAQALAEQSAEAGSPAEEAPDVTA